MRRATAVSALLAGAVLLVQSFTGGWVSVRTPSGTRLGERQHGAAASYREQAVPWQRVDDVGLALAP